MLRFARLHRLVAFDLTCTSLRESESSSRLARLASLPKLVRMLEAQVMASNTDMELLSVSRTRCEDRPREGTVPGFGARINTM